MNLNPNVINPGNSELRLSVREFRACQECRDQAQNTCSENREGRNKTFL